MGGRGNIFINAWTDRTVHAGSLARGVMVALYTCSVLAPHPAGTVQSLKSSTFPKLYMKRRERGREKLPHLKKNQQPITERK